MLGISVNFCEFHSRNLYKSFITANKPNKSLILYFSTDQGSKYLFLGNSHVILDVGENSVLYEVSLVSMTTTTTFQLCTFFLSTFNQIQNFIKLFFIHLQSKNIEGTMLVQLSYTNFGQVHREATQKVLVTSQSFNCYGGNTELKLFQVNSPRSG